MIFGRTFRNLACINLQKKRIKINNRKAINKSPTEKGIQPKIIRKKAAIFG